MARTFNGSGIACVSGLTGLAGLAALMISAGGCRGGGGEDLPDAPAADSQEQGQGQGLGEGPLVRVITWNVWRLFDSTCDSGRCDEGDYEPLPSAAEVDRRLDEIAAVIRGMQPQVALLQEIETEGLLVQLGARLGDILPYSGFGETGLDASVDVGVLSAFPIVQTVGHADRPLRRDNGDRAWFSRELLEARIDVQGRQLAAFTAHFRSKVDDDPERRRLEAEATAEALRRSAQSLPDGLVLLGGDLNDIPGSPPLEALERLGGLQRVAAELTEDADATYVYRGQRIALDHIYVAPTAGARYVPGSAQVNHDTGASDHAAVSALFEFR